MYKHILVATDGYSLSRKAASSAVELAGLLGARLTAFHMIPDFVAPGFFGGVEGISELRSPGSYRRSTERYAKRLLAPIAARAMRRGVTCDPVFVTGKLPWEAIIRAAKTRRCDLIVMASHGQRGVSGVLLGSETAKVLTHSRIPVLVCR